jgi:hypothetical protein
MPRRRVLIVATPHDRLGDHGPAGLVPARRQDGRPPVEGRRVGAFTDSEERGVGLQEVVPFLLEDRLRELERIADQSAAG